MARRQGHEVLGAARELIASSWTQHAEARDAGGEPVQPWDVDAVSWSLLGALVNGYERAVWAGGRATALDELRASCVLLAEIVDSYSLADWNDASGRTQADVLRALDAAIGLA